MTNTKTFLLSLTAEQAAIIHKMSLRAGGFGSVGIGDWGVILSIWVPEVVKPGADARPWALVGVLDRGEVGSS